MSKSKRSRASNSRKRDVKPDKKSLIEITGRQGSKRPILRFGLTVGLLMGLLYAFIILEPFPYMSHFFSFYQHLNAKVSGAILALLGHDIKVAGDTISSPDFSVNLRHGCDAVEPSALFVFAVLAFPAPFLRKIPGIVVGVLFLATVNILRVISLFLIGVYFPKAFHAMHVDVWQALFIFLAIGFWVLWALWAGKSQARTQGVAS